MLNFIVLSKVEHFSRKCDDAPEGSHQLVTDIGSQQVDKEVPLLSFLEILLRGNVAHRQDETLLVIEDQGLAVKLDLQTFFCRIHWGHPNYLLTLITDQSRVT